MSETSTGNRLQPRDSPLPESAWPASLTPLLGREQDSVLLHELLLRPEVRLVTITGPAGVGKTSLALHIARSAKENFADGATFVSLAPISDLTLIIPTVGQALNMPESPRRLAFDNLKEHLHNRDLLLVLDNFEHIISAAPLLTELLSACPNLRLLVTSREALRVRGEQEYLLSPLALPDELAMEALDQYPSIALFVQRAQAAKLEFRLTPENAKAVAEVCTHLDGLPLAIELAAARIKMFPPQAMLEQLQESPLQLLKGGARDLPARQQSLRRALRWSYDLLENEEQRALRWCSAFVGGSTLEAALTVLGPPTSVDDLESLVSKSLLRQIESNNAPRLMMLETIREFGWEQLTQAAELDSARQAHAAHYASLAEEAEPHLVGENQKVWLARLEAERDNLRTALQWAIESDEPELAMRMAGALQPFWFARDHWSEGRRWLEEALDLGSDTEVDQAFRAKALYRAGFLARYQGDFERARMLCEQSLVLYRALDDQTGIVIALVQLGRIGVYQDDQRSTDKYLDEAASLIEALPDSVEKGRAYKDMVVARGLFEAPVSPQIAHFIDESERIHRAFNNQGEVALALTHQSFRAFFEGDYALAASKSDEAERLALEVGGDRLRGHVALGRILLDVHEGDFATARRRVEENLRREEILRQAGNFGDDKMSSTLIGLVAILHKQDLAVWSARVLGLADAWASMGQSSVELAWLDQQFPLTRGLRSSVRAQLGDEAFARETTAGRQLTLDDVLAIPHPGARARRSGGTEDLGVAEASAESLTKRENEVLQLLDQDLSNRQIAERLVISRRTVDAHLRSIYDKLGVKSRDAATRVAREQGLLGE